MKRLEDSKMLLAGAGTETYLGFVQQFPMRQFCAFEVFEHAEELAKLQQAVLEPVIDSAAAHGLDMLVDLLVWRAHPDFVAALGYGDDGVERLNRLAVARTREFVAAWRAGGGDKSSIDVFLNADIGPRGDGYRVEAESSPDAAQRYHERQINVLADAGVDAVNCMTMTNVNETVGIVRAAAEVGLPCIVSPTVETDGRTPEGLTLAEYVQQVDAATQSSALFYMANCAHPTHIEPTLHHARDQRHGWLERFGGFRANASSKSHAELDESTELDRGRPQELGAELARLHRDFDLRLVGGCCGTDAEHIEHIAAGVAPTA